MSKLVITFFSIFTIVLVLCSSSIAQSVYKYKDENGRWVYSDKSPTDKKVEVKNFGNKKNKKPAIKLSYKANKKQIELYAQNNLHAPIQIKLTSKQDEFEINEQLAPLENKLLQTFDTKPKGRFSYSYMLGDPANIPKNQTYQTPVSTPGYYRISQSFNGRFSHSKQPSQYALDIAMPIGTDLIAARDGIVIGTKDDYHMGGKTPFFLDKANYVRIMHSDGTFASYGHILMGSLAVKEGDRVTKGQKIARSGTSGYSTGPHLHFVVYKNVDFKLESIPFTLYDEKNKSVKLSAGTQFKVSGGLY